MNIDVKVQDGKSGDWEVQTFTVTKEDVAIFNLRALFRPGSRMLPAGTYKRLMRNGKLVMSNTPAEIKDHFGFILRAQMNENILINGLGLGVALTAILTSNVVKKITIIEKSEDVINLIAPTFATDPRVTIIHADAFTWKPPKGVRYNVVWHDIWDNLSTDNLEGMKILHRKYGKRTDWQDSWGRELCQRYKQQESRCDSSAWIRR